MCVCVFVCVCSEGETQYDALYNNEITKFPWQQPRRERVEGQTSEAELEFQFSFDSFSLSLSQQKQ